MPNIVLAAECTAAVTGIQIALDPTPRPVSEQDAVKARRLPLQVVEDLRAFLTASSLKAQSVDLIDLDYMETLAKLTEPVDPARWERILDDFESPELAMAYRSVVEAGIAHLLAILPRRQRPTIMGAVEVEPSQAEMATFERAWQVCADPMQVLRDLAEGILVTDQVDTFKAVFPKLYAATVTTSHQILLDEQSKDIDFQPIYEAEKGTYCLWQTSPLDQEFSKIIQEAAEIARKSAPPEPLAIDIKGIETPNQRLADR